MIAAAAALVAVALAVASPSSSIRPAVAGNLKVGEKLIADKGTWAGSGKLDYAYRWYRCDALGAHCKLIAGETKQWHTLLADDGGKTLGVTVRATDSAGVAVAFSSLAGPIATRPVYASEPPKVSGTAEAGQELKVDDGTWTVTPQSIAYQWLRCNRNGRICSPIAGATTETYRVVSGDVAHALVAQVTAKVGSTAQAALSASTAPVAAEGEALPAGARALGTGKFSIPIRSVELPARLVVAGASVQKHSGLRVVVSDSRGYAVRGALVQVVAPYGWVEGVKEAKTRPDGTVTLPLRAKAGHPPLVVLYVRARKAGDDVLAGVTASRLFSVRP